MGANMTSADELGVEVLTQLITCYVQLNLKYAYPDTAKELPLAEAAIIAFQLELYDFAKMLMDRTVEDYGSAAMWARERVAAHLAVAKSDFNSSQVAQLEDAFQDFLQRRAFCRVAKVSEDVEQEEKEKMVPMYAKYKMKTLACATKPSKVCDVLLTFLKELGKTSGPCAPPDSLYECNASDFSFWKQSCPKCRGQSPGFASTAGIQLRQVNCFSSRFNSSSSLVAKTSKQEL